ARRDAEICSRLLLQKQLTVGFRACILHLEEPPLGRSICPARHTPILFDGSSFFKSFLCCFHPHPIEFVIDPVFILSKMNIIPWADESGPDTEKMNLIPQIEKCKKLR
ncbi:MAG: hypothetical protein IKQ54_06140, partial [Oscillospiraceae bacterium]|nr:hypothetical protein [Oscillospiraceae bacterium]MBR7055464.1 hypothetical protein [Oscillospiraceae bacterium]